MAQNWRCSKQIQLEAFDYTVSFLSHFTRNGGETDGGILEIQIQATDAKMQCILSLRGTWCSQGCHPEPRPPEKENYLCR